MSSWGLGSATLYSIDSPRYSSHKLRSLPRSNVRHKYLLLLRVLGRQDSRGGNKGIEQSNQSGKYESCSHKSNYPPSHAKEEDCQRRSFSKKFHCECLCCHGTSKSCAKLYNFSDTVFDFGNNIGFWLHDIIDKHAQCRDEDHYAYSRLCSIEKCCCELRTARILNNLSK